MIVYLVEIQTELGHPFTRVGEPTTDQLTAITLAKKAFADEVGEDAVPQRHQQHDTITFYSEEDQVTVTVSAFTLPDY
jgi:hypothetical protein